LIFIGLFSQLRRKVNRFLVAATGCKKQAYGY